MEKLDVVQPIKTLLDGLNYTIWSQEMSSFLKGRKLWRIITGDISKPTKQTNEDDGKFWERLEDWDSKNHQILTWIRNTTIQSIKFQFARFETAKEVWDLLAKRYSTTDIVHQYRLHEKLHNMKQLPGQPINEFLSEMQAIWDQLGMAEPTWENTKDAENYLKYRDNMRVLHFLMALTPEYEPVRGSILHRGSLPSLESTVSELLSEETRLSILKSPPINPTVDTSAILAVASKPSKSDKYCNYCRRTGHVISECRKLKYKNNKDSGTPPKGQFQNRSYHTTGAVTDDPSPTFSLREVESLLRQLAGNSSTSSPPPAPDITTSSALSITPGTLNSWFYDSGCCNHMTYDSAMFTSNINPVKTSVHTANNSKLNVSHTGDISTASLALSDAFLVPQLTLNLISVGQLCELGFEVYFSKRGCVVQDPQTGQIIGTGRRVGRLFQLISLMVPPKAVVRCGAMISPEIWHSRLGHVSHSRLRSLASSGVLGHLNANKVDCQSCQLAKFHALPFNNNDSISQAPFDLVHSDIWGPSPTTTMGGSHYFVIFVDDFSRYTWIYLLKSRSELQQVYYNFAAMVRTQFSATIKVFRSDNAQEYKEKKFLHFLAESGTLPQYSCPGTSQQNGRAERKHKHILETVRALLISAACPESFWGEAALTAVHTINRIPSPVIGNKSPYERLYGVLPNYDLLRVFGCACFVMLQPHERTKLESRARLCCFIGYGINHKGYRCWDPVSQRLRISRHVVFWEHKMFSSLSGFHLSKTESPYFTNLGLPLFPEAIETPMEVPSTTLEENSLSAEESFLDAPIDFQSASSELENSSNAGHTSSASSTMPTVRRSSRVSHQPAYLQDYHCYSAIATVHEPRTFKEARLDPDWQKAMQEELEALQKTHTWDLVDLPPNKTAIDCKWVYKIKTRSDGSVERYKARVVAKGYHQEYGIDYEETFAPVARLTTVRSLLAIAAAKRWQLFQMDVKNAFLNGNLQEEVYMRPPPGYDHPPNKVCRLRKALYGLKQAPRAWFAKFSSTIHRFGFRSSPYDHALFIRRTSKGYVILLLYVDDMIITGDDLQEIQDLKRRLNKEFEMKDLGLLNYFLGLEVTSNSKGYFLSQAKYASDLVSRAGLTDNKIASSPLEVNAKFSLTDGSPLPDATLYRQLVGSLVYLTVTRPDIAHAVHVVSQFLAAPRTTHYAAVLRILRYVKGTIFQGLHFPFNSPLELKAYSDSDWAGDPTDRRSTTGYCFFLGDSLISWRSKKQTVVARSSTEAEYRALADTTSELVWLRWLLEDLGITQHSPTVIYCDNRSAVQIAHNDVFHERTKHIEVDCHFVRQHLLKQDLSLSSVSSSEQTADIFTKSLLPGRFHYLVSKLNLTSVSSS